MTNKILVWYLEKEKHNRCNIKNYIKNHKWIQGKAKNISKAYDKINREKTLDQLEMMGIKGRMLKFIKARADQ